MCTRLFNCVPLAQRLGSACCHQWATDARPLTPELCQQGKGLQGSQAPCCALQEVYGKLEEPDGLGGLVRLRKGGPRPQDRVLAAEKEGAWSEALCLYEQALQTSQAWGEA